MRRTLCHNDNLSIGVVGICYTTKYMLNKLTDQRRLNEFFRFSQIFSVDTQVAECN
jgi:hypothetical protein